MININIIYPKDNWILQKIGLELLKIEDGSLKVKGSQELDSNCDINYYINWCYWKILYPELPNSKFDMVMFTHIDEKSPEYMQVLDKANLIICMSQHGKSTLSNLGIPNNRITFCPYWGVSVSTKKKIVIGTSGKDRIRKNREEIEQLKQDLDSNIFDFAHVANTDDTFFNGIDYYLQTSTAEGGSMDILNAIYARLPVISRSIGFIATYQTETDFIYNNYEELLGYFRLIEADIKYKDRLSQYFTWDNYRKWHIDLFKAL
jgi:hypothetical protein